MEQAQPLGLPAVDDHTVELRPPEQLDGEPVDGAQPDRADRARRAVDVATALVGEVHVGTERLAQRLERRRAPVRRDFGSAAPHDADGVGVRADHRDRAQRRHGERQGPVVVEKHHRVRGRTPHERDVVGRRRARRKWWHVRERADPVERAE